MNKFALPLIIGVFVLLVIGGFVAFKQNTTTSPASVTTTNVPSGAKTEGNSQTTPSVAVSSPRTDGLSLSVASPVNNSTVTTPVVVVRGKTNAKAQVAVNDAETVADSAGNFSVTVTLDEGENSLFVVVNDDLGNVTEQEITVIYESGQ